MQLTDIAEAFLEKVDFADDGTRDPRRLYPLGRSVPVVLDPDHGLGEPTLTSGVRTEAVAELVTAGEPRERVAAVYDIGVDDVDAAVRYENDRAAGPRARTHKHRAGSSTRTASASPRPWPTSAATSTGPEPPADPSRPAPPGCRSFGQAGLVVLTRRKCFLTSGGSLDLSSQLRLWLRYWDDIDTLVAETGALARQGHPHRGPHLRRPLTPAAERTGPIHTNGPNGLGRCGRGRTQTRLCSTPRQRQRSAG